MLHNALMFFTGVKEVSSTYRWCWTPGDSYQSARGWACWCVRWACPWNCGRGWRVIHWVTISSQLMIDVIRNLNFFVQLTGVTKCFPMQGTSLHYIWEKTYGIFLHLIIMTPSPISTLSFQSHASFTNNQFLPNYVFISWIVTVFALLLLYLPAVFQCYSSKRCRRVFPFAVVDNKITK